MHALAVSPSAILGVAGWSPAALGASLLGWWDAEQGDTLGLSGSAVTSWADIFGGVTTSQAVSASRPRWDANAFGGVFNRSGNVNTNPQNTSGMTLSGDPSAALSAVDGTALLAASGLSQYGPNVYKLDNSLGVAPAYVFPTGNTGNTGGTNTGVAWCAGGSGGLYAPGTTLMKAFSASLVLIRQAASFISGGPTNVLRVGADSGQIVYFTLNGLYDGGDPGVDVLVNGAPAYGFGRPGLVLDGSDDFLGLDGALPYPIGDAPSEIWVLADQQALTADTTTRGAFGYSAASGTSAGRSLRRQISATIPRGFMGVGDGVTVTTVQSNALVLEGKHIMRGTAGGGLRGIDVDATGLVTGATVAATGADRLRIGSLTSAANFWQGVINAAFVTGPLDATQAGLLTAYLKARGGIA